MGYWIDRMRKKRRKEARVCPQCNNRFTVDLADLDELEFDWRFCSEECEKISRDIDAAEDRRER